VSHGAPADIGQNSSKARPILVCDKYRQRFSFEEPALHTEETGGRKVGLGDDASEISH
jgi:hypothetical protein